MLPLVLLLLAAGLLAQQAAPAGDLSRLSLTDPQTARRLESKTFPGVPTRLCPSPDGTQLYVRTSERDRWGNQSYRHYLLNAGGAGFTVLQGEPVWAAAYWSWKSAPASPYSPAFRIRVETREDLVRTTNVPREGNIGQHTADPTEGLDEVARKAAWSSQKTVYQTFSVHGRVVALAVNEQVVPGRSFGWAPAPRALIAYASEKTRLVMLDESGRTREIRGTKNVLLPAWTNDGSAVWFLQKTGGKGYDLRVVRVG